MVKLFLLVFSIVILNANEALVINTEFEKDNPALYYVQDVNSTLSPQEVLHSNKLQHLDKTFLGPTQGPFWTRFTITNDSPNIQHLHIFNPLNGTNTIDVFLYENELLFKTLELGDLTSQTKRDFLTRYSSFELILTPNQTVIIVSKIENYMIYDLGWQVQLSSLFNQSEYFVNLMLGLYMGLILLSIIISSSLYKMYKDKGYAIITIYAFLLFVYQLSFTGIFYQLNIGLNLEFLTALTWNLPYISMVFLVLFPYYFFDMKNKYTKLSWIFISIPFIIMLKVILQLYAQYFDQSYFDVWDMLAIVFIFIPILLFIVSVFMYIQKEIGSAYYLFGQGALFVAVAFHTMALLNIIEYHNIYKIAVPIASVVDFFLLFLAQYKRSDYSQQQLLKHKEYLVEQAKFLSINQTIEHIIHQWKHPLSSLGTSITMLEGISHHKQEELPAQFSLQLPKIKNSIDLMKKTINEFSNFYTTTDEKLPFNISHTLHKTAELLHSKIILSKAKIDIDVKKNLHINTFEHIVANIYVILLDNSLEQFSITNNSICKIRTSVVETDENYIFTHEDTAGGVKFQPVEKIFEYYISTKSSGKGIGLAIVKLLVTQKLKGSVTVENTNIGAIFTITIPKQ